LQISEKYITNWSQMWKTEHTKTQMQTASKTSGLNCCQRTVERGVGSRRMVEKGAGSRWTVLRTGFMESERNGRATTRGKRLRRTVERGGGAVERRCEPDLWWRAGGTAATGRATGSGSILSGAGMKNLGKSFCHAHLYTGSFYTTGRNHRTAVLSQTSPLVPP
jgi:hypothetical protein